MRLKKRKSAGYPTTRLGWYEYYASRTGEQAEHLALWYQFLHLAFDEESHD